MKQQIYLLMKTKQQILPVDEDEATDLPVDAMMKQQIYLSMKMKQQIYLLMKMKQQMLPVDEDEATDSASD